jgi:hypothetical protein
MKGFYDNILAEVRKNKEEVLKKYGGIDGLHKHMDEDRPRLEKEGWHFATDEELASLRHHHSDS